MTSRNVIERVRKPAVGLIVIAVCNVLIWLRLFERLITSHGEWTTESFTTIWVDVLFLYLPSLLDVESMTAPPVLLFLKAGILMNLIIFYGAAHMMAGKRYYLSYCCSILVLTPLISPLFLLAVPVGLWSIHTLNQPEIYAALMQDQLSEP